MCRFVAYLGEKLLLEDVIVKPSDSLISQSLLSKESTVLTNGDGFGVGWYAPHFSPNPARFASILPAWNDENLLHLTAKIEASLFFAHVRAASFGGVNFYNCHPFIFNNWMFMHNGQISNFDKIKRHLRRLLDDDIYNWIRGGTDSEHFFALFLQLSKSKDLNKLEQIIEVLLQTFQKITDLLKNCGKKDCSYYNICLTNGESMIASRYCVDQSIEPESLHYLKDGYFWSEEDYLQANASPKKCVLIASEQLTNFKPIWHTLPKNHLLIADKNYQVSLKKIR